MNNQAAEVLTEIKELSAREVLPISGPDKGSYLVDTLKRAAAKTVLEVGTLVDYPAILVARDLPPGGMVHLDMSCSRM